jgi:cytoskeletal protein RodZ
MDDKRDNKNYAELLNNENDDLWDIFFPYMSEKQEKMKKLEEEKSKPGRHLRFITMLF